jgi:hypothetical protein
VRVLVGGSSKGSAPIKDSRRINGQSKMTQKEPTKPKKRVISTLFSFGMRYLRRVV